MNFLYFLSSGFPQKKEIGLEANRALLVRTTQLNLL